MSREQRIVDTETGREILSSKKRLNLMQILYSSTEMKSVQLEN